MTDNLYHRDRFSAETRRIRTSDAVGGWSNPGDTFQLKYVMPRFREGGCANRFDVQTAVVLYQTGVHDDIANAMVPKATVKGVGTPPGPAKRKRMDLIEGGADVLGGQIGLGGMSKIFLMLRDAAYGVMHSSHFGVDLHVEGECLGKVDVRTLVLPCMKYLKRNGFPAELFEGQFHTEQTESGVILVKLQADFTREQVEAIMAKGGNTVDPRYGVPRLVARISFPETELDNIGNAPYAVLHTATRHTTWEDAAERRRALRETGYAPETQVQHLDPVRYMRGAELEGGYREIVAGNVGRLREGFHGDPELQMQHLAARLYQVYTRSIRLVQAVCRKRGYGEELGEITEFFTAAFNRFRREQEKERSIGSVYIPVSLSPSAAPCLGERASEFMRLPSCGDEILERMLVDLEMTCTVSRDPDDYLLALCEQAEHGFPGGPHPYLRPTDVQNAYDPDLLFEVAERNEAHFRGVITGKQRVHRKRIRRERSL